VDLHSAELDLVSLRSLAHYSEQCEVNDHRYCTSPGACQRALHAAMQKAHFDAAARMP
jgi:hypothetical protein